MNILFITAAIILIIGILFYVEYLNHGIHLKIFDGLLTLGFSEIGLLDGKSIAPIYIKIRPRYSPSEEIEYDYTKIFKRVLLQKTEIGICYALLWLGGKGYSSSIHILLEPNLNDLIITHNKLRTDNLPDLKTIMIDDDSGLLLKISSLTFNKKPREFDELVAFLRKCVKKNAPVSLSNNVLSMSMLNLTSKNANITISEFIKLTTAALSSTNGNFA